jgi:hypothetical protein
MTPGQDESQPAADAAAAEQPASQPIRTKHILDSRPAGLDATEAECAPHAVAPRVSLQDIEGAIAARYDTTADKALGSNVPQMESLKLLSVCFLVMRNGFTVIGKSAPASAENFNAELGRKLAYEDAVRQIWPLMGYALRDKLAAG